MITQCRFSLAIHFFKKGFFDRWKLKEYKDSAAPCLFFGAYTDADVAAINGHRGLTLVWLAGADIRNAGKLKKTAIIVNWVHWLPEIHKYKPVCRIIPQNITYRDFSKYTPQPLGTKIYCYQNSPNDRNKDKYRFFMLEKVIERYGDKVIIGYHGNTEAQMMQIYRRCFINLQFSPTAGFGSTLEMAHMGRPSVSKERADFCYHYETMQDIYDIIDSVQPNIYKVSEAAREFVKPTDWQNENQYL